MQAFTGRHHLSIMQRIGMWAFVRHCRNQGVSFETCYFLCFGRMPTRYSTMFTTRPHIK
jgi:hypothetical protein